MNANSTPPALAERVDVHRSCKSLETLLTVLNDYCEAAGAVVTLQKKLAKALRETAGLKTTAEIPGNALNGSATIFEALSEIDTKFAKILDREYDGISAEVKKWFKKLAKEEKAHDERISNANARIKQAGQTYERKSKKNARDATEEHARYINLITALGPEISQEKYNHALGITQRHTTTTFSVAACVSRVADAEWVKTCEAVRRFSPTIGPLGEWRALCEGAWEGPLPQDLPNIERQADEPTVMRNAEPQRSVEPMQPESQRNAIHPTPREHNQSSPPNGRDDPGVSTGPSSFEPPRALVSDNTGSIRSLSAFPSPPTHFPIPPLTPRRQQTTQTPSSQSSLSHVSFPTTERLTESPLPAIEGEKENQNDSPVSTRPQQDGPPPSHVFEEQSIGSTKPALIGAREKNDEAASKSQAFDTLTDQSPERNIGSSSADDREFGVLGKREQSARLQGANSERPRVEKIDTGGSTSSIVAALRSRYSQGSGSSSPPPRDIPRLPLSVNDLASRYQPIDGPSSPRIRTSPTAVKRNPSLTSVQTSPQQNHNPQTSRYDNKPKPSLPISVETTAPDDEAARRRRNRLNELAVEFELKDKERQLRERENEVELRARELERDRARLMNSRDSNVYNNEPDPAQLPQAQGRPRNLSFQQHRPQPQYDDGASSQGPHNASGRPQSHYSYSTTHLPLPGQQHTQYAPNPNSRSHPPSPRDPTYPTQSPSSTSAHAPYCGCDSCSISKYRSPPTLNPSSHDLRPPEKPISLRPEKPKGWMRRLSMPVSVGNAFSLDSKKSSAGIMGGKGISSSGGGGLFSLDGRRNGSTTGLRSAASQEDGFGLRGDRRSYETSGVGNRSVTNLGRAGR
ncbi:hypothetical protein BD779DRAFT_1495123 [Infundibulicybe gibba]|nr:hypothetical protein BD779DRAFT_1495123 [Infundibulicybe gibba]